MLAVFDWEIRGEKNRYFQWLEYSRRDAGARKNPLFAARYSDAFDVALDSTFQINGNVPQA